MKSFLITFLALCVAITIYSQANTKLTNLVSPTAVNQSLIPGTTNTRDLGTSTLSWKNMHLRGDLYMDGGRFLSNHPGGGAYNVFVGMQSAQSLTTGKYNSTLGYQALYKNTTGSYNTAVGTYSLYNNTSGYSNTAIGLRALNKNTTGYQNTALAELTLYSNTTGTANAAIGNRALYGNTTGSRNTANGYNALASNTVGYYNVAIGYNALPDNVEGWSNVALGSEALLHTTSGYNTGIGQYAGYYNSTKGTFLGAYAYPYPEGQTNVTAIGYDARTTASNQVRIGNINVTSIGGYVGWSNFSDGRYKQNVKQDVHGLDFINSLRPVTYTVDAKGLNAYYNKGREELRKGMDAQMMQEEARAETAASKIIYNGFVAQEVEEAAKKLNYEFSGVDKPQSGEGLYGLRYADFVVPLVKAVQELSKENQALKSKAEEVDELKIRIQRLEELVNRLTNGENVITVNSMIRLEQNTPNPVNGNTRISYSVPEGVGRAQLILTDAIGRTIKVMQLSASGVLNVDASTLSSGVYNYSLMVDGKTVKTKKMVVVHDK